MARRSHPDPTIGKRIETRRKLRGWSIRFSADRAGMHNTTWSRIERGLIAADNRFTLADIAQALECETTDLTGTPLTPTDPKLVAAQACVPAIRQALVETDLEEEPAAVTVRPLPELRRETELIRDLFYRYDYAAVGIRLPGLLRELHAAAAGSERATVLRLMVEATHDASFTVRYLGHPAEAWLAAERCRQVAGELADPVALAVATYVRAHAATSCGGYARGLRLASRAVDALQPHLAAPDALPMLGMLLLTCAFASRALHQADDSGRWVTEAGEIAGQTGETSVMHFGPTNINIWRVSMETDGGDPGKAVEIAAGTRPSVIPVVSRQTCFHVDTARALARLRGREESATRHLLIAERIGPQMVRSSALVRETARALLDRAQRNAGGSQLRGLCERVGVIE